MMANSHFKDVFTGLIYLMLVNLLIWCNERWSKCHLGCKRWQMLLFI